MEVAVFSTRPYDRQFLDEANTGHHLDYFEARLAERTAPLAEGHPVVCAFVNDILDDAVLNRLAAGGTGLVALRSAGHNHVDLEAAARYGITVARVPAYSPEAVAEHTVGLMLMLDRHLHRAYNRTREGNFSLDGLLGSGLRGRTVSIVGTGSIGVAVARILAGFGCHLLAVDPFPNDRLRDSGVSYVDLHEALRSADIVTLHCPLTPDTHHLIDSRALAAMKRGVMLINTSRGGLVDTQAVIDALKEEQIGSLGLDVYEEEAGLFFEDLSNRVIRDDVFSRLLTFPNVVITGHQAYFTEAALRTIAKTTIDNITAFAAGRSSGNEVTLAAVLPGEPLPGAQG